MPRHSLKTFLSAIQPVTCLLALDVSAKRIGMAVTDPGRTMALPCGTLVRRKWAADVDMLIQTVQQRKVGGIVISVPLNMNGSTGPAAQSRLTFGRNLDNALSAQGIDIPYVFVDESLTSHAARDVLGGRGNSQNAEDQLAACQLLAEFISHP